MNAALRVLICGSRDWQDVEAIRRFMRSLPPGTLLIEGGAHGADFIAKFLARQMGNISEVKEFPADWERYGRAAGAIRNGQMLVKGKPHLVVAFHEDLNRSKGTKDMVAKARAAGVRVLVNPEKYELP